MIPSDFCRCCLLAVALTFCLPACVTTSAEGERMRGEIEALKAQQDALGVSLKEREANMAGMIAQARKENESLKEVIKRAQDMLQKSDAEAGVDMQQMRTELDQLRGKTEEISFTLEKLGQDIQLFKEDVDLRLQESTKVPLPAGSKELMSFIEQQLKAGQYQEAGRGAEAFVKTYPGDAKVDRALFLLGESHFMQKQYISSIYAYQRVLKEKGTSALVPDAAYRIGEAFLELGRCDKSKLFLDTVVSEYSGRKDLVKRAKEAQKRPCTQAS